MRSCCFVKRQSEGEILQKSALQNVYREISKVSGHLWGVLGSRLCYLVKELSKIRLLWVCPLELAWGSAGFEQCRGRADSQSALLSTFWWVLLTIYLLFYRVLFCCLKSKGSWVVLVKNHFWRSWVEFFGNLCGSVASGYKTLFGSNGNLCFWGTLFYSDLVTCSYYCNNYKLSIIAYN